MFLNLITIFDQFNLNDYFKALNSSYFLVFLLFDLFFRRHSYYFFGHYKYFRFLNFGNLEQGLKNSFFF